MNATHSTSTQTSTRTQEYWPTIIENRLLVSRLVIEGITSLVLTIFAIGLYTPPLLPPAMSETAEDIVLLDLTPTLDPAESKTTPGGSGRTLQSAHVGGGSGGDHDPNPPQRGKIPPPSPIPAPIPITPPVTPQALPLAGVNIDPASWKDLKAPVYGDPRSTSNIPSRGPGEGGGIGSHQGTGIGDGAGPGVGDGDCKNAPDRGCGGDPPGGARGGGIFRGSEVEQRARLLSKPEPQYTEEARKNQISGTVMLRAVFSSSGEVIQIRALNTLPFGLTERAIAAARLIKFVPAMKNGRPVSVFMQLEYNFNLY